MFTLFVILHVLASLLLILVVLLQSGKAGDLASAFGGAGSQAAFGARGTATLLTKATTVFAILFMISSLGLALLSIRSSGSSVMERVPYPEQSRPDETQQESPAPPQEPAQEAAPEQPSPY